MSLTGNRAFTLLELIVVIVIVSVLATMIAPRLYSATGSAQLRATANRLLVTAQYARDFAVTHRLACQLIIDQPENSYCLAYEDDQQQTADRFQRMRIGIGKSEQLGERLKFSKVWIVPRRQDVDTQKNSCIIFEPTGQADTAVIEISDGTRVYSLLVTPHTGQIKLVEGHVNKLPNDRLDLDA